MLVHPNPNKMHHPEQDTEKKRLLINIPFKEVNSIHAPSEGKEGGAVTGSKRERNLGWIE